MDNQAKAAGDDADDDDKEGLDISNDDGVGGLDSDSYQEDDDALSSDEIEESISPMTTTAMSYYTTKVKYDGITGVRVAPHLNNLIYQDNYFKIYMRIRVDGISGNEKFNVHVIDKATERDVSKVIEFTKLGLVIHMRYFILRECFCSRLMHGSDRRVSSFQREPKQFGTRIFQILLEIFKAKYNWKLFLITWLPVSLTTIGSHRTGASSFFTNRFGFVRDPHEIAELIKYAEDCREE
jgi:hypothetical protein